MITTISTMASLFAVGAALAAANLPPKTPQTPEARWNWLSEQLDKLRDILTRWPPDKFAQAVKNLQASTPSGAGAWGPHGERFLALLNPWMTELLRLANRYSQGSLTQDEALHQFVILKGELPPLPSAVSQEEEEVPVEDADEAGAVLVGEVRPATPAKERTIDLSGKKFAHVSELAFPVLRGLREIAEGGTLLLLLPDKLFDEPVTFKRFKNLGESLGEELRRKDLSLFEGKAVILRSVSHGFQFCYMPEAKNWKHSIAWRVRQLVWTFERI